MGWDKQTKETFDIMNTIGGALVLMVLFSVIGLGSIFFVVIAPVICVYLIFRIISSIIDGIQAIKTAKHEILTGNDELYAALYDLWLTIYSFKDYFIDVWNGKRSL